MPQCGLKFSQPKRHLSMSAYAPGHGVKVAFSSQDGEICHVGRAIRRWGLPLP